MGIMNILLKKQKQRFNNTTLFFEHYSDLNGNVHLDQSRSAKRLKIAIVTETWAPEINGVANSLLNLCKGVQGKGHQILLIRPKPQKSCEQFTPNKECWVKAQAIPHYPSLQFGWPQISKISKAIDDFEPDIVHIVTEGPLGLASLFVAKSKNIPISSGYHSAFQEFSRYFEFPFLVKPITHYLKWFHNRTQITCVPSLDTAQSLEEMGVTGELKVVGRGVNIDVFNRQQRCELLRERWGVKVDTRVLISVGRLSPEKEVNVVIETFKKMQNKGIENIKLVIVGDGPDRSNLEILAGQYDVIFMGSLTGLELAQAYASADIFVFPSQVETFGNVALEALASGLPIIAYDYACAKLHVQHGKTGWLVPLGEITALTQIMEKMPDASMLREMGAKAERNVAEVGWMKPVNDFESALYFAVEQTCSA